MHAFGRAMFLKPNGTAMHAEQNGTLMSVEEQNEFTKEMKDHFFMVRWTRCMTSKNKSNISMSNSAGTSTLLKH